MEKDYISADIEDVEHYLEGLFQLPVGICIADTQDIVRNVLGYEISDLRREPDPNCRTAFQYVARIEWATSNEHGCWRVMYVLYRREVDHPSARSQRVEEAERRPLLEMPIEVQRHAHHYLAQLVAAAGGEWQLLRRLMYMKHRRVAGTLDRSPAARNAGPV